LYLQQMTIIANYAQTLADVEHFQVMLFQAYAITKIVKKNP
jgi:hypothetical protein